MMALLDYQALMLPLLKKLNDCNEHELKDLCQHLVEQFKLSEEDLHEVEPSMTESKFHSQVHQAITLLQKARLMRTTSQDTYIITQRGLNVLAANPQHINLKYLEQFEDFYENHSTPNNNDAEIPFQHNENLEEILEECYDHLAQALSAVLLNIIMKCSPPFFEKLVVDLLVAMGYGGSRTDVGQVIGKRGDEGIDGIIKEDALGFSAIYLQAKRWNHTVGRPEVQAFAGSLEGQHAQKGVFITTSRFSNEAKEYVKMIEKKIVLIDGKLLIQLMVNYEIGVSEYKRYIVKRIDNDYFMDQEDRVI